MNKNNKDIEETLDIKRENYKLRKENFELLQDNAKLLEEINRLNYKLKEKICFEGHSQFKELNKELETYKKIVDFMTEIVKKQNVHYAYGGITQCIAGNPVIKLCDGTKCKQCIIDWARKEVENERKNM